MTILRDADLTALVSTQYLRFAPIRFTGKTFVWDVSPTSGGTHLGEIRWFSAWRKYCFFPTGGMVFDASCLRDITNFIDVATEQRKR